MPWRKRRRARFLTNAVCAAVHDQIQVTQVWLSACGESLSSRVLLALLAIIALGVGFTVHWLFIIAVVLAIVWLISLLAGGVGGRTRGTWW
jgi:hypothetical protein